MSLVSILQTAHLWANTGVVFRELSFSRLECGVHDRLHIYPLCGIFYFPWHRHQIEGTNGFYCLIRKTERFTISNVESQVFTPNNSRLDPGSNPGCPRDKRMSYHWTNCANLGSTVCSKLLGAHAITGCDTVSYPFGKGKASMLKTLKRETFQDFSTCWVRKVHLRKTSWQSGSSSSWHCMDNRQVAP